jgi:hypothetical protein
MQKNNVVLLNNHAVTPRYNERPAFKSSGTQTIPDVVERTIPAVVSISISADVPVFEQYYDNFWSPLMISSAVTWVSRSLGSDKSVPKNKRLAVVPDSLPQLTDILSQINT